MVIRTQTPPDLRRLCSLLTQWQPRSITEIATGAGVDKSNLSRFVRRTDSNGFSPPKLKAVMAELGWGGRGPVPSQIHFWALNDAADAEWMFGDVLGGQAELTPLYHREVDSARGELSDGVLLGKIGDALLVITKALLSKNLATVCTEEILERLTDAARRLARVHPGVVIPDRALYDRLRTGEVELEEVNAVLSGEVVNPKSGGGDHVAKMLEGCRASWLDDGQGRSVLMDAYTRFARMEPGNLVALLTDARRTEYERTEGKRVSAKLKREWADRAALDVSKIASRPYLLTWHK